MSDNLYFTAWKIWYASPHPKLESLLIIPELATKHIKIWQTYIVFTFIQMSPLLVVEN